MKKARLMLSALGVCTILATAFTFTAQKLNNKWIYTGTSSLDCTHPKLNRTITLFGDTLVYATLINGAVCTKTYTTVPLDNN